VLRIWCVPHLYRQQRQGLEWAPLKMTRNGFIGVQKGSIEARYFNKEIDLTQQNRYYVNVTSEFPIFLFL
jgi:hypothetical protein